MKVPPFLTAGAFLGIFLFGTLLFGTSASSQAAVLTYYYSGVGTPDAGLEVQGKATAASDGTFRSDIVASEPDEDNRYTQFNLLLNILFQREEGDPILLGDIASSSYSTRTPTPEDGLDWALRIYTAPTETSHKTWFNLRFDARNPVASAGEWGYWDMDTAFETGKNWFLNLHDGATNSLLNLSLSDVTSNPLYAAEEIGFLAFYVGSSANSKQLFNEIANIRVVLKNGDEVQVNMVPEPTLFSFCAAGGLAYALFRRKRFNSRLG